MLSGIEGLLLLCWDWNWANFVVNLLVGVGTIGVVLLVLYQEFWRTPKLEVEFDQNKEGFCRYASVNWVIKHIPNRLVYCEIDQSVLTYWVRIKVINIGKTVAKNVVGRVNEMFCIKDNKVTFCQPFDPCILHWVGQKGDDLNLIDVNKKEYYYLDILFIEKDDPCVYINTDLNQTRGIKYNWEAGDYLLKIALYSENAKPVSKTLRVVWNGKWNEIEVSLSR
ncbi:MAG TPA: hypothetical protein VGB16_04065 [candidate division Zixibacteria bacterium]